MLQIRPVTSSDEIACLSMDPSFVTDHVWQMEHRVGSSEVEVQFRTVHLPRLVKLAPPWGVDAAFRHRKVEDFFILTEEDLQLRGFLYLRQEPAQGLAWLDHLVIGGPFRRKGRGVALLEEGRRWSRSRDLRAIIAPVQTRNYPALRFIQKQGFRYSGYSDHYFPRDVAVFFQSEL